MSWTPPAIHHTPHHTTFCAVSLRSNYATQTDNVRDWTTGVGEGEQGVRGAARSQLTEDRRCYCDIVLTADLPLQMLSKLAVFAFVAYATAAEIVSEGEVAEETTEQWSNEMWSQTVEMVKESNASNAIVPANCNKNQCPCCSPKIVRSFHDLLPTRSPSLLKGRPPPLLNRRRDWLFFCVLRIGWESNILSDSGAQDIKASVLESYKRHRAQVAMIGDYGSCSVGHEGYTWSVDWGDDESECSILPQLQILIASLNFDGISSWWYVGGHLLRAHFSRSWFSFLAGSSKKIKAMSPHQAVHTYAKKGKYNVEVTLCAKAKGCSIGCTSASKKIKVKP